MSETRVVRGLFFGLCLALFLGVALTVAGLSGAVAQGAVMASTSTPSPAVADLVGKAPEGTFVIAVFNVPKVMADPSLKAPALPRHPHGRRPDLDLADDALRHVPEQAGRRSDRRRRGHA